MPNSIASPSRSPPKRVVAKFRFWGDCPVLLHRSLKLRQHGPHHLWSGTV